MNKELIILIADDDFGMVEIIEGMLRTSIDCKILKAYDGKEVLSIVEHTIPDLILLDWTMPKLDGWEVCRKLRQDKKTCKIPIIMLTARSASEDEVIGLEAGADDFITKPFKTDVLVARVKAILRRFTKEVKRELKSGEIYINLDTHTVQVKDKPVNLWPKEFELLYFLMKKKGNVIDRDTLLEYVWGYEYFGTTRAVDATIKRLREKLGAESKRIETIKGVGYRFTEDSED